MCVLVQFFVSVAVFLAVVVRYKQDHINKEIIWGVFLRYTLPHFSFCFLVFAIVNQSWKDQYADFNILYNFTNVVAPTGTLIVVLVKMFEPHTDVCLRQCRYRLGLSKRKITEEEWKEYAKKGEQLDTQLGRSIMLEALYLTLRCVHIQTDQAQEKIRKQQERSLRDESLLHSYDEFRS